MTWLLVLGFSLAYFLLALFRHLRFESGAHDLGLFTQVLWHHSRFEVPETTILGLSHKWGDHFHPLLNLLAPLFWIHSGPLTLLALQSLAIGISVIPVYSFCERRLGRAAGLAWSSAYLLFWGLQIAAVLDFHDIVLAVPVLAWALDSLDRGRTKVFLLCLVLLLLTRENLALLAAVLALGLCLKGRSKLGWGLAGISLVWFLLAVLWIIPSHRPEGGGYGYWTYTAFGSGPVEGIWGLLKKPWLALTLLFDQAAKVRTLAATLDSFLYLPLLSPWGLASAPLLAERFWSDNPKLWGQGFHYSALIAPVIAMAGADGARRLCLRWIAPKRQGSVLLGLGLSVLGLALWRLPDLPFRYLVKPSYFILGEREAAGRKALALIPPGASVAAQEKILAHLSCRKGAYVLKEGVPETDFILASQSVDPEPYAEFRPLADLLAARLKSGYSVLFHDRGWILLAKPSGPGSGF